MSLVAAGQGFDTRRRHNNNVLLTRKFELKTFKTSEILVWE